MTRDEKLEAEEQIMVAVCELCRWPYLCEDEDAMYAEHCDNCPADAAVIAALGLAEDD